MMTRILPAEEWGRLVGTDGEKIIPFLNPSRSSIVVVEKDGKIVGHHVLMDVVVLDGLWIHPDERGHGSVAKRLWNAVQEEVRSRGVHGAMTHAIDANIRELLEHVGAEEIPAKPYMVMVESAEDRRDILVGERFHEQLERQLSHENHPEDRTHNRVVGHALREAIERGNVSDAVSVYNKWAKRSGYMPITLVGSDANGWTIDMGTELVYIDKNYTVSVKDKEWLTCQ